MPPRTAALLRGGTGRQASLSSKLWFSKGLSGFPDDFPGLFVVSKRNELRVTKMVCVCPFQKVYAGYGLWSKPHAFLHLGVTTPNVKNRTLSCDSESPISQF
jgi:hypothetical protein